MSSNVSYIQPHKYMNLEYSLIHVSSKILKELLNHDCLKFNDLLDKISIDSDKENNKIIFVHSLSFLYCLGKIEYSSKSDVVRIVK